jgi:hypothetical protein
MQFTYSPTSPVPILLTVGEIEDGQEFDFNDEGCTTGRNPYIRDGDSLRLAGEIRILIIPDYWIRPAYRISMSRPAIIHP